MVSGDKPVSVLFLSVECYLTYTVLPPTIKVPWKLGWYLMTLLTLYRKRMGSEGWKVESQARECLRMSCCRSPRLTQVFWVRLTKNRHHSREERRKTHLLWVELYWSDGSGRYSLWTVAVCHGSRLWLSTVNLRAIQTQVRVSDFRNGQTSFITESLSFVWCP